MEETSSHQSKWPNVCFVSDLFK